MKNIAVVLMLVCFISCSRSEKEKQELEAPLSSFAITNAEHFSIDYMADGIKLVTDYDGRELLLVPRGASIPQMYKDKIVIYTPVEHALFMSPTEVSFLCALNEEKLFDSIAAVTTAPQDWTVPQVFDRLQSGAIKYIPQVNMTGVDTESVLELKPDIIFTNPQDQYNFANFAQLAETGLPYAVIADWMESSLEASIEWLKFIAAFYNMDAQADTIYKAKLKNIDELSAMAEKIPPEDRPIAVYGIVFNGLVWTQGGESTTAQVFEKAGAKYYLKNMKGTSNIRISFEEFFDKAKNADVIIWSSMYRFTPDKKTLVAENPLLKELKAYKNNRIYVLSREYYMNSADTDTKFGDMLAIFHPQLFPNRKLTFYVQLPD